MRIPFLISLAALCLSACAPSIDAAAKADVDRRVGAMAPSGKRFEAPSAPTPMPLAVGQWVTYKMVDQKGQPSLLTLKLVGQEGAAFWYETESETYYGKSLTRMLVDFGDRRRPESVTIKSAKLKDAKGNVTEYPENLVGMMNSILRGNLGPIAVDWTGLPQEEATAPAGSFSGCWKGRSEVSFAGLKSVSTVWSHTAVPISGMIRSLSDDGMTGELMAFGIDGARSSF